MKKKRSPKDLCEVEDLLKYLNFCHDGSITKICFTKEREVDTQTGSLIYPYSKTEDFALCDVSVEMLLNSYPKAKKEQVVVLEFKSVRSFTFTQERENDYSDIYEVKVTATEDAGMTFDFYATERKVKTLSLSCEKVICTEV